MDINTESNNETALTLSIPVGIKIFMAAILIFTIFMLAQLPSVVSMHRTHRSADENRLARNFYPAMMYYLTVLERHNNNTEIILNAIESAMGAQHFHVASYILDTHIVGRMLSDYDYNRAVYFDNLLEKHFEAQNLVFELLEYHYPTDYNTDALISDLHALLRHENIDLSNVFFILSLITEDSHARLNYLRLSVRQNPNFTYTFAHYGNALRRAGYFDYAMYVYQEALHRNASDTFSMRGIGVLNLLAGEYAEGMRIIRRASEINPNTPFMTETFVIALNENGMRNEAIALMNSRIAEGHDFAQDFHDYMDGIVSLAEHFTD